MQRVGKRTRRCRRPFSPGALGGQFPGFDRVGQIDRDDHVPDEPANAVVQNGKGDFETREKKLRGIQSALDKYMRSESLK
jgi:hypothetical protein